MVVNGEAILAVYGIFVGLRKEYVALYQTVKTQIRFDSLRLATHRHITYS